MLHLLTAILLTSHGKVEQRIPFVMVCADELKYHFFTCKLLTNESVRVTRFCVVA